jgi:hypothetical protein
MEFKVRGSTFYLALALIFIVFNRVQYKQELDTIEVISGLVLHWPFLTVWLDALEEEFYVLGASSGYERGQKG